MNVVTVMFDSLNRHLLPNYGCDWTCAPNFRRLAGRSVTFDRSYVCSMPCMPARRDQLTGRPNFLHRSWGPLEPFDDSVPRMLREAGVSSHLISDHYHYWETGGATYHTEYTTWQFFRGQEGDPWMGQMSEPRRPERVVGRTDAGGPMRQDFVNRGFIRNEEQWPISQTFAAGIDFLERNGRDDGWFLQIETFDPHEPFYAHRKFQDLYPHDYDGDHFDWPAYRPVTESPAEIEHCRRQYAALLSQCDSKLGDVLDVFDRDGLWSDTMLIVWTDHGFMLGEHDCWAKCWMPFYEEVAHTPFFVWDPRCGQTGERRRALVQPAIDLGPTLLEAFGLSPTADMTGVPLRETIAHDAPVRQAGLFGIHGGQVNVTDGRYVYWRGPARDDNQPLHNYTLMPADMRRMWPPERFRDVVLAEPFAFTKDCPTLKTRAGGRNMHEYGHRLYDLETDPGQHQPLEAPDLESRMIDHLVRLMNECDAPVEQFERLGLER